LLDHVLEQLSEPDSFIEEVKRLYNSDEDSFDYINFKDGRIFERYSCPLRYGGSLSNGRVWSFRNITERRQTEANLQKKSEEVEQFLYSVSHDLRSPLVTVKTFMGYLEKDMSEGNHEHLSKDIGYINGAADKMKLLLDELLELSRIDHVESTPVRISLIEMMNEVVNILAGDIKDRNIDISLPDKDMILLAERQRIIQIWQNLIENAIKYSRDDNILCIELGVQNLNNETVFYVKDNGKGIDSEYHTKIFGIFEKLDSKSPGAGLGLSMVHRIVGKYGGRIWVESEGVGKGSCFCFTLPRGIVTG
jgi:signal transduction histidine kinase